MSNNRFINKLKGEATSSFCDWTLKALALMVFIFYFFNSFMNSSFVYMNDYLNPFTLTFKNPKTIQMLNIIILYHYVMAFLIAIIVFTFVFIFLSFFRSYPFFYNKFGGGKMFFDFAPK